MPNFGPSGSWRQCSINEIMIADYHLLLKENTATMGVVAQQVCPDEK
jgi:hypothetical protein